MGIVIDIVEDDDVRSVSIESSSAVVINNSTTAAQEVVNTTTDATVVEVLRGLPGLQNVFVTEDGNPPAGPFENMVWIDVS